MYGDIPTQELTRRLEKKGVTKAHANNTFFPGNISTKIMNTSKGNLGLLVALL
jgi:hypothetical protein